MGRIFHAEGERELGRACQCLGVPQCVSTSCSFSLPEVMDAVEDEHRAMLSSSSSPDSSPVPVFFQLYVDRDRSKSERILRMVQERGAKAIFLTVDAPVIGKREADERIRSDEGLRAPMSGASARNDGKGGALGRLMGGFIDASVTWDDVAWVRRYAPGLPVVLKGVQTHMDAERAMRAGVDAIYVSNHGGRSLDTAPATVLVLLEIQKNCPEVFDRMEVYVDGGITRGADVFKALCLGARAVGIGRGFLYALNYGKEGIEQFVNILMDELVTTMQMCGITSLDQVHPGLLNTGAVDHLIPSSEEHPYAKWRPNPRSKL
ncbi:FMN-dependent dehydrogenase [Hypoxylon sp. FL1284]|nr:FMN-dependent dehydrogenase [Hypoxylon sp. FL1284]